MSDAPAHDPGNLPLHGLRVVEMTPMVMGPTCGMILSDLGAEVITVEPLEGNSTRRLPGAGAGFLGTFNRKASRSSWRPSATRSGPCCARGIRLRRPEDRSHRAATGGLAPVTWPADAGSAAAGTGPCRRRDRRPVARAGGGPAPSPPPQA